ncbi:unnamed protein product [Oppiella nova]|uniref:Carboxypeptidase n=1 Tax=Oppiella nova TaxID=334625 RepID=A0A7R9MDU5_9ACAR|nr:unnamed protein product [Oppiella nova]CAG2175402.1 unnamed protein product [Oppiella nova]
MTENGPFSANEDGVTLSSREHAWNTVANMVFMESPVSTGFSYDETTPEPHNDDVSTANDNYLALESFFEKYPHLKGNPFYITGESYGGVYVPMLATEIFKRNSTINLKATFQNKDWLLAMVYFMSWYDFALGHGLVTTEWYEKKIESCCECKSGPQHECDFMHPANVSKCESVPLVDVAITNPYNIYDNCAPDLYLQYAFNTYYRPHFDKMGLRFPLSGDYNENANKPNCPKNGHTPYLNRPDVRQALHVREGTKRWIGCGGSYDKSKAYTPQAQASIDLIHRYKIGRYVVYNGDFDIMCDFVSDQRFVDGIAVSTKSQKIESYREWRVDGKPDGVLGGFVQHYENGLSFVLVRGAGHMVPEDKPEAGLQVFKHLLGKAKL